MTINLEDNTDLELEDVDINIHGDTISFFIEGEITDIKSDILDELTNDQLTPVEITFKRE